MFLPLWEAGFVADDMKRLRNWDPILTLPELFASSSKKS